MSFDQVTRLFMKIDANSDGTVSWNEFSDYMISLSFGMDFDTEDNIYNLKQRQIIPLTHKDNLKYVAFIPKERKYLSIRYSHNIY